MYCCVALLYCWRCWVCDVRMLLLFLCCVYNGCVCCDIVVCGAIVDDHVVTCAVVCCVIARCYLGCCCGPTTCVAVVT